MESCILGNNKFGPTFITRFGDASHSESDQGFLTMSYTKAIIVIWFFTLSKFLIRVPFKNKPNNNLIYMKTPEQRTLDIVTQVSMLVHGPHMLNHLFICLLIVSQTTVLIETTSSLRFDDRQNRCESYLGYWRSCHRFIRFFFCFRFACIYVKYNWYPTFTCNDVVEQSNYDNLKIENTFKCFV